MDSQRSTRRKPVVEIPTLFVASFIYLSWLTVTYLATDYPILLFCAAFIITLHGSLQHETIHGHPTSLRWLNTLLGAIPLGLFIPYGIYRETHLTHHNDRFLTDPKHDPESFYIEAAHWEMLPRCLKALCWIQQTVLGRLAFGPLTVVFQLYRSEFAMLRKKNFRHLHHWFTHFVGIVLVLYWVRVVCGISMTTYLLCFAYPGLSLTLMRSFLEHRPNSEPTKRTAIVEANPFWGMLFLYNNLHVVHHLHPTEPWYKLPQLYRDQRESFTQANGGYVFSGYSEVIRRFGVRPKDQPIWNRNQ